MVVIVLTSVVSLLAYGVYIVYGTRYEYTRILVYLLVLIGPVRIRASRGWNGAETQQVV